MQLIQLMPMKKLRGYFLFFCLTLLLTGCGNLNAIHKKFYPNQQQSISIDAKQRVVYSVEKNYGKDKKWSAICAEPSPDALSAISASGAINAKVLEKALTGSFGSQESAASIGLRTQSIQILRDAMYRLCEGYASGAMDNVDFGKAQRRYQDVMLALLAIEQLTGTVVAKQVAISNESESIATKGLDSLNTWIEETQKAAQKAAEDLGKLQVKTNELQASRESAKTEYDKLVALGDSDEQKADAAKYKAETLDPAVAAHEASKTELEQANVAKEKNDQALKDLKEAQESVGSAAAKQVGSAVFAPESTRTPAFTEKTAAVIADAVVEIVKSTQATEYGSEWCFDFIADLAKSPDRYSENSAIAVELKDACLSTIKVEVTKSLKRLGQ